jgi:hypothetical protein
VKVWVPIDIEDGCSVQYVQCTDETGNQFEVGIAGRIRVDEKLTIPRWEYHQAWQVGDELLNDLGDAGWELVTCVLVSPGHNLTRWTFKRRLP